MEISHLKARHNGLQEEVQNLQQSAQSAAVGPAVLPVVTTSSGTTLSSSYLSRPAGSHQGFHGDEMDFSDVIWSQQEINRLSTEVRRLEADVAHWRRMSQVKQIFPLPLQILCWFGCLFKFHLQASTAATAGNGDHGEILRLQRTIKVIKKTRY